ncbi:MAG: exo-alpha-sialidase [Planctomycetota bacterium]|nr:MAG: exo-alpha-sialidase [Planctomycetota bacterium]
MIPISVQSPYSLARCSRPLVVVLFLIGWGARPAQPQDSQPVIRVTRISPTEARSAVEVSVGINPTQPDNLVAAAIMRGYPASKEPNFRFVSHDGGATWTTIPALNPDQRTQGDDVIAFHADGTVIHGYICFTGLWDQRPTRAATGIFIGRSTDGGNTWEPPAIVVDHQNTKTPMEDKPWFCFDRQPDSDHFGNLYASWTRFDVYGSEDPQDTTQILFARSTDGGRTFEPVYRISDAGGSCVDGDDAVEGAVPCVGVDGTVYVAWAGPRGIEMDVSQDGGQTFGTDRVIATMHGGWDHQVEGVGRANGMPVTAVDHSSGPFRGSIYVNFVDERNGDPDVFLISSRDSGATWSEPVRVNADRLGNGRDQFFTWMAVDPVDGSINIAYYDRGATEGTRTGITLARSRDGGRSFEHFAVPIAPFTPNPKVFFGDYLGIDAWDGRVVVAFMHFTSPQTTALSAAVFDF